IQYFKGVYAGLSAFICVGIIIILLITVSFLPPYGAASNPANNEVSERYIEKGLEETGAVNIVAGMILDYRAFDTFGESCVLFVAASSVMLLLRKEKGKKEEEENRDKLEASEETYRASSDSFQFTRDIIVKNVAKVIVPMALVFGVYIVLNGHLSPGGGFSGGAVMGASLILYSSAFGYRKIRKFVTEKLMRNVTFFSLAFYAVAKSYSFFTGANHMATGIPLGIPGHIISSGLILPLNIAVGLIVTCTMYSFYSLFSKGEI
ncbi:MAG: hydrogen gas-evolving membrane-bound hydrogenase subunit E, partial [Oscillospiraceae bacterium]